MGFCGRNSATEFMIKRLNQTNWINQILRCQKLWLTNAWEQNGFLVKPKLKVSSFVLTSIILILRWFYWWFIFQKTSKSSSRAQNKDTHSITVLVCLCFQFFFSMIPQLCVVNNSGTARLIVCFFVSFKNWKLWLVDEWGSKWKNTREVCNGNYLRKFLRIANLVEKPKIDHLFHFIWFFIVFAIFVSASVECSYSFTH